MVGKNLLVHKALGETKNSVFQEETVLSQAKCFQCDNGTDIKKVPILASCLFGQLIRSIIAEISAMAQNIRKVDVTVQVEQNRLNLYNKFFCRVYVEQTME
ncbi:hypothetical protein TNCV_3972201 [Trichonephila clavipes]|nr:hypothetical protein TNCV_3972201 [Trichonephila clavipes]